MLEVKEFDQSQRNNTLKLVVNEVRRTTLLALGIGAAAFSMTDRKRRKRMARIIEPIKNMEMAQMMPSKRTVKKLQKRMMRTFS